MALQSAQRLGEVVARAQLTFIQEPDRKKAFETLLNDTLALTHSAYGFVARSVTTPMSSPT